LFHPRPVRLAPSNSGRIPLPYEAGEDFLARGGRGHGHESLEPDARGPKSLRGAHHGIKLAKD
jgi:hypothetical protein